MGEYIKLKDGTQVKLGTCEDLMYARYDQVVAAVPGAERLDGNAEPAAYLDPKCGWRYRFPFPDEDGIGIGQYEDYDRMVTVQINDELGRISSAWGFEHYHATAKVQAKGFDRGTVCYTVPCPNGAEKCDKMQYRPAGAYVGIKMQRLIETENGTQLWTVVACPYCGAMVRLDEESGRKLAEQVKSEHPEISRRILVGYEIKKMPPLPPPPAPKAKETKGRSALRKMGLLDPAAGTHDDPIRYERIDPNDPDRAAKLKAQREKFEQDAKAGKVLCLSDLMISHGM